ncbi:TonB-dependent receptor [Ponticaulis koreensis]|uniref:TonB-dependent receptor n=1 Tax=Ponticaulis koreensis TaxID=1123045 RepID=UPI00041F88C3|nr:TonB-dependent receptor [Ponticaulis koreensis]
MRAGLKYASMAALAFAIQPTFAHAQDDVERIQEQSEDEGVFRQQQVVVTGSAIRGTPEDAALPVEVFTQEDLALEGAPTALQFAKDLTISGPTSGESNYFGGGPLLASPSFNLRSLGADKTLTLLNGRRMSQNLSNIPSMAIGRTEILKDGAAVIYGGDAVGGVVNFITRTGFTGFEARGNFMHVDGSNGDFDMGFLAGWGEGDVNLMVSAEWEHRSRLETEERDFSSLPYGVNPSPWSTLSDLSRYTPQIGSSVVGIAADFTQASCEAVGGIYSPTSCAYGYLPFYNLVEDQDIFRGFAQLDAVVNDNMNFHVEAAFAETDAPHQFNSPSLPALRGPAPTTGATFQYEVPLTNPYAAQFFANTPTAAAPFAPLVDRLGIVIFRPFAHQGNPVMGRGEGNSNAADINNQVWRVSAGIDGTLGDFFGPFSDVGYDAAITYNSSNSYYQDADYIGFRLQDALNGFGGPDCAVVDQDPTTPGVQAPGLEGTNGCEFFNPFSTAWAGNPELGLANPNYVPGSENSDALTQWLFDPLIVETLTQSTTFDLVFDGTTGIELPGGEIGWAAGGQARAIESREIIPSDLYNGSTPCPYPGTFNCPGEFGQGPFGFRGINEPDSLDQQSYSFFVETNLPITDDFNMQAAVRREEFSGGLGSTVYKVAGRWQVFDQLALRGSYGTNFAAPPVGLSPGEINSVVRSYGIRGGNWLGGTTVTRSDIEPEEATVWNVGAIWESQGFESSHDLRVIVDYFDIELVGELDELIGHADLAAAIANDPNGACSSPFINRVSFNTDPVNNPTGTCQTGATVADERANFVRDFNSVQTDFGNGADRFTSGIDLSVTYEMPVGEADVTMGLTATRLLELETGPTTLDGVQIDGGAELLGELNFSSVGFASPEWRTNAFINYNRGDHNVRLTARYVSSLTDERFSAGGVYDGGLTPGGFQPGTTNPFSPIFYEDIDSSLTFDATYVYDVNDNIIVTGTMANIFDEDPPFIFNEFGYDPRLGVGALGRTIEVGVKLVY